MNPVRFDRKKKSNVPLVVILVVALLTLPALGSMVMNISMAATVHPATAVNPRELSDTASAGGGSISKATHVTPSNSDITSWIGSGVNWLGSLLRQSIGSATQLTIDGSSAMTTSFQVCIYAAGSGSVTYGGASSGTVNSNTIVCLTVGSGASLTFQAAPNSGYAFSGWNGAFTSNQNPITETVTSNLAAPDVTANFQQQSASCNAPTISLNSPTLGTGANWLTASVNGFTQPGGSSCSITSISWTWGDGQTSNSFFVASHSYSSAGTYSITATTHQSDGQSSSASTSVTIAGLCVYIPSGGAVSWSYNSISGSFGDGQVSCLYPPGGTVLTLTAVALTNYQFQDWTGSLSGTQNPTTIIMNAFYQITANFQPGISNGITVTFSTSGLGSDATGNVIDINGVVYDVASMPKSLPWTSETSLTYTWYTTLSSTDGTLYEWSSTIGCGQGSASGVITVTSSCTITATYSGSYSATFTEIGLPQGTEWSVILNGVQSGGSSNSITFSGLSAKSYPFTVNPLSGYSISPATGTLVVSGSGTTQQVTFLSCSSAGLNTLQVASSTGGSVNVIIGGISQSPVPATASYNFCVQSGTSVSLTGVSDSQHFFSAWSGSQVSTTNPLAFQITSNTQETAIFYLYQDCYTQTSPSSNSYSIPSFPASTVFSNNNLNVQISGSASGSYSLQNTNLCLDQTSSGGIIPNLQSLSFQSNLITQGALSFTAVVTATGSSDWVPLTPAPVIGLGIEVAGIKLDVGVTPVFKLDATLAGQVTININQYSNLAFDLTYTSGAANPWSLAGTSLTCENGGSANLLCFTASVDPSIVGGVKGSLGFEIGFSSVGLVDFNVTPYAYLEGDGGTGPVSSTGTFQPSCSGINEGASSQTGTWFGLCAGIGVDIDGNFLSSSYTNDVDLLSGLIYATTSVIPSTKSISGSGSQIFTALVGGSDATSSDPVSWQLSNSNGCGSIQTSGEQEDYTVQSTQSPCTNSITATFSGLFASASTPATISVGSSGFAASFDVIPIDSATDVSGTANVLSVTTGGSGSTCSGGSIVTVEKSQLPYSTTIPSGTDVCYAYLSPVASTSNSMQYVWSSLTSVTGSATGLTGQYGSFAITSSSSITSSYIEQMQLVLSYQIVGGGSPSAPTFSCGAITQKLTTTPTTFDVPLGCSWSVTNPLAGSASTERWETTEATSGTPNSGTTIIFSYNHQYFLQVVGGNGVTYSIPSETGDNWYNSGDSLTISSNWIWNTAGGSRTTLKTYSIDSTTFNPTRQDSGTLITGAIVMSSGHVLTFSSVIQYQLVTSASTGGSVILNTPPSISGDAGWYDLGTSVTITAVANSGYSFLSWTGSGTGSYSGSANPASLSMNGPVSETATFLTGGSDVIFTETGLLSGSSWNVVFNGQTYPSSTASLTISNLAAGTYSWSASIVSGATGTRYSPTPGSGNITVTSQPATLSITFTEQYQVTMVASPSSEGTTTPSGSVWVNAGSQQSISATPATGYTFKSWTSSTSAITLSSTSTASSSATVNGPGTLTANFGTTGGSLTLSLSSTSGSAATGKIISTTLTITGTPQIVTLSISGLPKGVTATWAHSSITDSTAGVKDKLTLRITSRAPHGTYVLTITAKGANGQIVTVSYTLTVT